MNITKSSGNLYKDAGFSDSEAKRLKFRSSLMFILIAYIQKAGMTQKEAAEKFGVSQPRISNLVHCDIDKFSNGNLLDMLEKAGFNVYEQIENGLKKTIDSDYWINANIFDNRNANNRFSSR